MEPASVSSQETYHTSQLKAEQEDRPARRCASQGDNSPSTHLSVGAIVGIVMGGALIVIVLAF
jgi:hypothetical protein